MSKSLIHIKDILNNTESICNLDFQDCATKLIDHLSENKKKDIKYTIYEKHCEIYYDHEINYKGWIWSTSEIKKDIIYLLTYIPLLTISSEKSTQTDSVVDNGKFSKDEIEQIKIVASELKDSWPINVNPIINGINTLSLSDGYARSPFIQMWPDDLTHELKNKLTVPKYGLKSIYQNYSYYI